MEYIAKLFEKENVVIVISLWMFVVGVCTIVYSLYSAYRRRRNLSNFGLSEKSSAEKTEKYTVLHDISKKLTNMVAATDDDMADKLIASGIYNTKYAYLVLPLKYASLVVGLTGIVFYGIKQELPLLNIALYSCMWLILTIVLPDAYLSIRQKSLQRKISNQLPYLLDLMGVCVQTGMTIEASFSYLSQEMAGFDRDLAYLLKRTNERANIVGLAQSLEELYIRTPTPEVRSFVMTLNQSLQYGSSIYKVLTTLAVDIREVQLLVVEEKIGKLSAKMSIPLILFIMIPIVILITAPGVMRMMS